MNNSSILLINEFKDLKKLRDGKVYVNLKTNKADVINYLIDKGSNYYYSSSIGVAGYVYVDYETFVQGETIIQGILDKVSDEYTDLEKTRYVYIALGKMIGQDINASLEKNDVVSFLNVGLLDNLWSVIINNKGSSYSVSQLLSYMLSRLGISCEVVKRDNSFINEVAINDNREEVLLSLNLYDDLYLIQGFFQTKCFGSYNLMKEFDKSINYIADDYNDIVIRNYFSLNKFKNLFDVLIYLQDVMDIGNMGTVELYKILSSIISEYYYGDVLINNLYHNTIYGKREHFVLISNKEKCYSYNYKSNNFMLVKEQEIANNIISRKVGLYLKEKLPTFCPIENIEVANF